MRSTQRHTVFFTIPQAEFLKREAERLGINVSELLRRIVDSYRETRT